MSGAGMAQLLQRRAVGQTPGVLFSVRAVDFFYSILALGPTQLPIHSVKGIKRPGREDNHTAINCRGHEWWSYTSTTPYVCNDIIGATLHDERRLENAVRQIKLNS
jgi:hypothetical protein